MHPGGATILSGAERALDITPEHMRASYDTYINHGNSSSATIFSVLDRLRTKDMDALAPGARVRDLVVACAFGPGIAVEMCLLKRNLGVRGISGLQTPPETESEASSRSDDGELEEDEDREAGAESRGEGWVESNKAKDEAHGRDSAEKTAALEPPAARHPDGLRSHDDERFISEALAGVELD